MVEDYIESIIQELLISRVVTSFKTLKREDGDEDGYVRIKCSLSNGDTLEFAEFFHIKKGKVFIETYSYHWQSSDSSLLKRWDNVAHHKAVETFPHHLHLSDSEVTMSSPMTLKKVLAVIEKAIPAENGNE
jgi:hypothetical protein